MCPTSGRPRIPPTPTRGREIPPGRCSHGCRFQKQQAWSGRRSRGRPTTGRGLVRVVYGDGEPPGGTMASFLIHGGVVGGILLAAASTWKRPSSRNVKYRPSYPADDEDGFETAVRWSVMSVLSCVPYVNYMAWVFAALDSSSLFMLGDGEEPENKQVATHYWILAAVYALPYLIDGFHLDTFTLATLSIGVLHVQIERGLYYGDVPLHWFASTMQALVDTMDSISSRSSSYESAEIDDDIQRDLEDFDKRLNEAPRSSPPSSSSSSQD